MTYWACVFFVIALISAVFGFSPIAPDAAGVARILSLVFSVLANIALVFGLRLDV
jgi:uncharacterized membrane protein YtjA (UPF0391 family)